MPDGARRQEPWRSFGDRTAHSVQVMTTPGEVDTWRDAAVAYIAETEAAADELWQAMARWAPRRRLARRLPGAGARRARRRRSAEDAYAARMAAAAAAYRPVLEQIEARTAIVQEEERVARERAAAREKADRAVRYAVFQEWSKRQAAAVQAADLRLLAWEFDADVLRVMVHDVAIHTQSPLTARELAKVLIVLHGRGCNRVAWEPAARRRVEETAGAGTFPTWWRDLLCATVNARARHAAEQEIVATAERVGRALLHAGNPGMETYSAGSSEFVTGWPVVLDWPEHLPPPAVTPPPLPWANPADRWRLRSYDGRPSDHRTLTLTVGGWPPDSVRFAELGTEIVYQGFTRQRWRTVTPALFARILLDDEMTHRGPGYPKEFTLRIAEHADPRQFVPFVTALAGTVTTALLDVACRNDTPL
ncbi:hypothetical protein AB0C76_15285 [Kitasatospora sp. NPDC048722]|uniref:hypothetical protein n=1 Tax=Kitasatospora sp. NPDC048722 TaxID=3155639 RepID=UPI0033D99DDC